MRKSLVVIFVAGVVSLGTGCSTFFDASAPAATAGSRYAVGSKAGFTQEAKVWLCPDSAGEPADSTKSRSTRSEERKHHDQANDDLWGRSLGDRLLPDAVFAHREGG